MAAARALWLALAGAVLAGAAPGATYLQEELHIPAPGGDAAGLETLLVRADQPGRHPLALIEHGSPRDAAERPGMSPYAMLPQALAFAERGFVAAMVMRRGYGGSGGGWAEDFGGCGRADYTAAGERGADDLRAAITFLAARPEVDATRVISVGVSAGGFATVALTAKAPPGLLAAISFAGGRGSTAPDTVCQADALVAAFRTYGRSSRVPMLWVYAENDHFFGPALAERLREAFVAGGGAVSFIKAPSFGGDGHLLFSGPGLPIWAPMVDDFLRSRGLALLAQPLPGPEPPALNPPGELSQSGREAFAQYLASAPHKAFAIEPHGGYGWRTGQRTVEAAREGALENCLKGGKRSGCRIIAVDDAAAK